MAQERLQKILAHAGIASRRAAEGLITSGHIRVNGKVVTELGVTADIRKDRIEIDGKKIVPEKPVYFVFHKPRGMVTTLRDPEGRPHLGEIIKQIGSRIYPVGRLDFHTSGVLLLTNDGELTEALLHPRKHVPKTYVAKVRGMMAIEELDKLRNGVVLDDGHKTKKADVFVIREEERNTWIQITLYEGKNRQIHRMGEALGRPILRLARTAFANVTGDGLKPGEWRAMGQDELDKLKKNFLTPFRRARDRELAEMGAMGDIEEPVKPPRSRGAREGSSREGSSRGASSREGASRGAPSRGASSRVGSGRRGSARGDEPQMESPGRARAARGEAGARGKRTREAYPEDGRDGTASGSAGTRAGGGRRGASGSAGRADSARGGASGRGGASSGGASGGRESGGRGGASGGRASGGSSTGPRTPSSTTRGKKSPGRGPRKT